MFGNNIMERFRPAFINNGSWSKGKSKDVYDYKNIYKVLYLVAHDRMRLRVPLRLQTHWLNSCKKNSKSINRTSSVNNAQYSPHFFKD